MTRFRQQVNHTVLWLDQHTHGWPRMLAFAVRETLKPVSAINAAAISYFAIFSFFPLTLLSIAVASFSFGTWMNQQLILQRLEFLVPDLGQLLGKNIDKIIQARGPISLAALAGLAWSASTILTMLTSILNEIWGIKRDRPFWRRRGLAILFVLAFAGPMLFLASFAGSWISNLRNGLPAQIMPIGNNLSLVAAVLLDIAFFMLLYILLPHGPSSWRGVLPGAVGAGLLWELAKNAFLVFISTYLNLSNLVYGSVAAIIAFLTWAYLSGLIFLFGAFLNVSYHENELRQKESNNQIK